MGGGKAMRNSLLVVIAATSVAQVAAGAILAETAFPVIAEALGASVLTVAGVWFVFGAVVALSGMALFNRGVENDAE